MSAVQSAVERALPKSAVRSAVDRALPESAVRSAADRTLSEEDFALHGADAPVGADAPLLVAYSGGRDSTVLLHLVCRLRDTGAARFGRPIAAHVDHGLQRDSSAWAEQCLRQCEALKMPCLVRPVQVQRRGLGLEAAAREARYGALAEAARATGAAAILTAHHLDDLLETFLLQWIRGAGPDGLTAMSVQGELRRAGSIPLLRPLLHIPRAQIESYIERHALPFLDDPSNADPTLDRNAIRLRVMPELARLRPGFRGAADRSIELIAEAADVARALAREDLQACTRDAPQGTLRIDRLALLPPARRAPVLREWLAQSQLRTPPRARLLEAVQQAVHAGADARMLIRIGQHELRRHHGLLCLVAPKAQLPSAHALQWRGEACLAVPEWGGELLFTPTDDEGFDAGWLRSEALHLRPRTGGERFKPHPTRPSKRLKQIFQEARIPEYERASLPLVWRDGRLIFVAGIGADVRVLVADGERIRMEWVGAARLLRE